MPVTIEGVTGVATGDVNIDVTRGTGERAFTSGEACPVSESLGAEGFEAGEGATLGSPRGGALTFREALTLLMATAGGCGGVVHGTISLVVTATSPARRSIRDSAKSSADGSSAS